MLQLGQVLFRLTTIAGQPETVRKIQLLRDFFSGIDCGANLRRASLCLQLTQHAVSITGQTKTRAGDVKPLIVRLAQGEVQ